MGGFLALGLICPRGFIRRRTSVYSFNSLIAMEQQKAFIETKLAALFKVRSMISSWLKMVIISRVKS
jgi:hypothetical protein